METSQPLSIESFSYSWLVNLKPSSLESLDVDSSLRTSSDASDDACSFIEMDPSMTPSERFFTSKKNNSKDFKFEFPTSECSPLTVVHADELFSNGYLIPFFEKMDMHKISPQNSDSASSVAKKKSSLPAGTASGSCSLRRCRRLLSKRLLQKYLDFFMPLYRRLRGQNKSALSSKAETMEKTDNGVHSLLHSGRRWKQSSEASPSMISVAHSADDGWSRSCDSESSIYEAVLHCKRSIERSMRYYCEEDMKKRIAEETKEDSPTKNQELSRVIKTSA